MSNTHHRQNPLAPARALCGLPYSQGDIHAPGFHGRPECEAAPLPVGPAPRVLSFQPVHLNRECTSARLSGMPAIAKAPEGVTCISCVHQMLGCTWEEAGAEVRKRVIAQAGQAVAS